MGDFVTLTCPTCGGKLQITPDIDRFACTHCGNEHIVKRSAGTVAIQPLADSLSGLQRATDRTAAELGLRRVNEDLTRIETRYSSATRALSEAQAALKQGRQRQKGVIIGSALIIPAVLLCAGGTLVPMLGSYLQATSGQNSMDDPFTAIMCSSSGGGLLLLIVGALLLSRALSLPRPTLSSSQAEQATAAARTDVAACAAELQAKQAEIERLRREVSRDEA